MMSKPPGGGCDDPRQIHDHWCSYCGAQLFFTSELCQQLRIIPPCPRCGEKDWRNDIDELTAPNHKEATVYTLSHVTAHEGGFIIGVYATLDSAKAGTASDIILTWKQIDDDTWQADIVPYSSYSSYYYEINRAEVQP